MPFDFTLDSDGRTRAPELTDADVGGEDIALDGGDLSVNANGDFATVTGVAVARQSILREIPANPGSFARRPEWGGGLSALLLKGSTVANRDRAESRTRGRLLANIRVSRVNAVSAIATDDGMRLTVDVDVPFGRLIAEQVVKPPGVR